MVAFVVFKIAGIRSLFGCLSGVLDNANFCCNFSKKLEDVLTGCDALQ